MKIKRAKVLGVCMGVKRALNIVEKALKEYKDKKIYTLGPLIHNPQCIEDLKMRGVIPINENEIEKIKDKGVIVIRAHGISPSIRNKIEAFNITLIDATCPNVLKSHHIVNEYANKGFHIVIVGDKDHGEIKGIQGIASRYDVIENSEEAQTLQIPKKSIVIGQTTFKKTEYKKICDILRKKNPDIIVFDNICSATENRQKALIELSKEVEALLIIGGKNSANTRRLYLTAKATGKPAWHIEDIPDIPSEIFKYNYIGISAGASTPDWIIEKIENYLYNYSS